MGNLAGWPYWKVISITGQAGAGTDYQVKLTIGDSAGGDFHLEGHCTNFPQDIRITDDDGTTLLDHFVEDLTADPIIVRVKVNDDLGSNRDIRVYYGKSGETTASNGANTFLQYHGSASSNFLDSLIISSPYIWEGKLRSTNATHNLTWGLTNVLDLSDDNIRVQSYSTGNAVYHYVGNEGTTSNVTEAPSLTINQWYRGKISNDGTTTYGYFDDNEIGSGGLNTNLPNESLGLFMNAFTGTCEQAWSFARKYNSPEPAFSSAGSEETPPVTGNPYWYYQMLKRRN